MPGRSFKDDIPEVQKTSPEIRQGSEPAQSLEFRAEVIPYDNCEDPNAPILAFSGENMNLIFNIPKERFLKLAVAAIDHLGRDSDFKSPENNSSKQSGNLKRDSNEISKSRLSDVVHCLDGDNTNEIVNAYEEDSNETPKNKDDMLPVDIKLCVDYSNRPIEICGEYQSGSETEKPYLNVETKNFEKSANFQSSLADSDKSLPIVEKYRESSEVMKSSNGSYAQCESNGDLEKKIAKDCENTEEKVEETKSSNAEDAYVEQEQNSEDCEAESEVDIAGDMNLSAHSLDISAEDCPELENAWPEIYPYEKTEEIPVTGLKSLELKDVSTKYFKLELSNEFIVIKVTSGSGILVDAAKYKKLDKESISKAGSSEDISEKESTQSFINEVCIKSLPADHKHADSVDEKLSKASKSANCEPKDDHAVVSEEATGTQITSELVDKSQDMEAEFSVTQNVKTVFKGPIQIETLSENSSDIHETVEAGSSKSFELYSKAEDVTPSNVEKSSSANETFELGTANKVLGNPEFEKIITLKIEQKLEELDTNIPGVSPTERLRFTLNDSLKSPCGKIEAKKQMEECVTTENLLKESDTKVSLLEKFNERISVSPEKCPKEISQDEFVAESSDSYSSNMVELGHEKKSESLNVSSNAEKELAVYGSEHSFSAKSKLIGTSLDNSEAGLADGDAPAVGKLISNDPIFESKSSSNADVSLEESNVETVSMNLSSGDKDSFEDSALGNDLHVSESESLNFSQSENMKCKETNSQKNLDNVPCKQKNETLNDVGATSILKHTDDLSNELSEKAAIKENGCRKESIIESTKLKVSGDLKCLAEKKTPQGTSINGDSVETFENKLNADIIVSGKNFDNTEVVKEVDKLHEISEDEYTKPEKSELVGEISDALQSSSAEKTPEDKSQSKISEIVSSDDMKDVKNGKAETENIPESIADANDVVLDESHSVEHATNESSYKHPTNKPLVEQNSECIDMVSETALDTKGKLPENSFSSNMDSFMDSTADTNLESASEGGDFESDDKSIASESDDGKDSDKQASKRKGGFKGHIREADEVDCAPTRVRTKKAFSGLSKDVIPENSEVKNGKASKYHDSYLKSSGKTPLGGRSLRSKSLDPTPQTSKGILHEIKHGAESEEMTRRARAKTPDIVSKKDLKSTARSSPRKFTRAASTEPSSTKVESNKTTVADDHSKSRANLDSSISTRRGKRGSKE